MNETNSRDKPKASTAKVPLRLLYAASTTATATEETCRYAFNNVLVTSRDGSMDVLSCDGPQRPMPL